jgi:translation initiation factor 6
VTGLISFNKNPNIGVVARANDETALVPALSPKDFSSTIQKELDVEVIKTNISGTSLIGSMMAMNNNGILIPKFAYEKERVKIKKAGLNVEVLQDKFTALGNLILFNDKGAIVYKKFTKGAINVIEDIFDIEVAKGDIAGFGTVGSLGIATNKGALVHPLATDDEIEHIESVLGVEVDVGTVNRGAGFVRTGILANNKNVLMGDRTTGPEITRIEDALGLL